MPRLERGMDPKIDMINDLVYTVKNSAPGSMELNDSMEALLRQFKPMILKTCKRWSEYFNDSCHKIKSFDELVVDAEYWFAHYTMYKYVIDGRATYNKFITDHISQRIRYIYECELKYYKNNIFPDPHKSEYDDSDSGEIFEQVVHTYKSDCDNGFEDDVINQIDCKCRIELAHRIMELVGKNEHIFNERERMIFEEVLCNGTTQDEMGKRLGISRTRIVQIIRKIKSKLYVAMNDDKEIWSLVSDTDILFDER